jgi:ABC-type polysaccharide/polyol phosphate transport system ATPase subunit
MTEPYIETKAASIDYPIIMTGAQQSLFAGLANTMTAGRFAKSGNVQYVTALNGLTLSINAGERVGLVGRNGAGKSTALRMLAGVLPPSRGHIDIQGTSNSILNLGAGMDHDLTGYENIARMSRLQGIPKSEWDEVKRDVEDFTELGKFLALPVRTYSAGMNLRLGFAMATTYPRDILVIDELIGAGDMFFIDKALARIESFANKTKILIMATHGLAVLESFCSRGLFFEGGKLKADGSVRDVWHAYVDRGDI